MALYLVCPYTENQKKNKKLVLWRERINIEIEPCRTISAGGVACRSSYYLEESKDIMINQKTINKPSYKIPLMHEIEQIPHNGYYVVSTFSGAGGSCLGYRMAGYKVLWASEFVSAAQDVYKCNHPDSILDVRDIRKVQPEEILEAIKKKKGEIDIFDGSPPCNSFSMAGKREKTWGKTKKYFDQKQTCDDLFFEYARILKGLQPKVFVAENVSGLIKGVAKGYFIEILKELKSCGYRVKVKLLDAQWLGVPQMRQRVIFIGVREDLKLEPIHPKPLPYNYTVREAIPWITTIGSPNGFGHSKQISSENPYHTVGTAAQQGNGLARFIKAEADISKYDIKAKIEPLLLPPSRQKKDAFNTTDVKINKACNSVTIASPGNDLAISIPGKIEKRKFSIAELKRICAFPDDFILTGSYAQQWARLGLSVPPVMMKWISATIQKEILEKLQ